MGRSFETSTVPNLKFPNYDTACERSFRFNNLFETEVQFHVHHSSVFTQNVCKFGDSSPDENGSLVYVLVIWQFILNMERIFPNNVLDLISLPRSICYMPASILQIIECYWISSWDDYINSLWEFGLASCLGKMNTVKGIQETGCYNIV